MTDDDLPDGTRIRDRESGDLGTVVTVVNGPDALDLDDTITIVEWDSNDIVDGPLRDLRDYIEEIAR